MTEEAKVSLKDRIVTILSAAGKPLDFEKVYEKLANDGHHMPSHKPKLVVRKSLYSCPGVESIKGGMFQLIDESADGTPAETKAPAPAVAKPPAPKPAVSAPKSAPAAKKSEPKPSESGKPRRKTSERIITILADCEGGLTFEQIYERLKTDGYPMPPKKPLLVVRKVVHNEDLFHVVDKNKFALKEGIEVPPEPEEEAKKADPPKGEEPEKKEFKAPAPVTEKEEPEKKGSTPPASAPAATGFTAEDVASAAKAAADEAKKAAAEETKKAIAEAVKEASAKAAAEAAAEAKRVAEAEAEKKRIIEEARKEAAEEIRKAAAEAAEEARKQAVDEANKRAVEEATKVAVDEARKVAIEEAKKQAVEEVRKQVAEESSKIASAAAAASTPAAQPEAPAPVEQAPVAATRKAGGTSIRERATGILNEAGKPLSFGEIYEKLSHDGHPLPNEKPKSVVSKVLYNKALFVVSEDGLIQPV